MEEHTTSVKNPSLKLGIKVENEYQGEPTSSSFRIYFIKSGSGIVRLNDKKMICTGPSIFCLNEQDNIRFDKSVDLSIQTLYFQPTVIHSSFTFELIHQHERQDYADPIVLDLYWLNPFIVRANDYHGLVNLSPLMDKRITQLFDQIDKELTKQEGNYWVCRSRSFLIELLFFLSRTYKEKDPVLDCILDEQIDDMEEILLYLHSNYRDKITLDSLTKNFCMNRTKMNEKFKKVTGQTVITYLIKLRVQLASVLLKDTSIPIKEIGYRVGFEDIINFGRTFKKEFGCTPSDFRERSWQ